MAGIDTFAIDVSSTFMNVASDSATVPSASIAPESGAGSARAAEGVFTLRLLIGRAFVGPLQRVRSRDAVRVGSSGQRRTCDVRSRCRRKDQLRNVALVGCNDRLHPLCRGDIDGVVDRKST